MERKNFTRIPLYVLITVLLFALLTPICAFADESTDLPDNEMIPEKNSEEQVYNTEDSEEADAKDKEGFFDILFRGFSNNLSDILSALAFIGSLILMFSYKQGFLPLIKDGLGALSAGVRAIGEKTGELNIGAEELAEKIDQRLKSAEDLLNTMKNAVAGLETNLKELQDGKREREMTNTVLLAEVDMLYEIFMSASLPQYLKDNVGEKIADMRKALAKEDKNEKY